MLGKADTNATLFVVAALGLFFIGGLLTTVVPPLIDKSWAKPFENHDPVERARRASCCPTPSSSCTAAPSTSAKAAGIATRSRPARCWPTPSAPAGRAWTRPISTPDEFVYDNPHMFGTKRTGPDLSRVGGKYDTQWHRTHFRNPRDLVPGSVMPPFPWIADNEEEFTTLVAYIQTLGRAKNWRPDNDYEK